MRYLLVFGLLLSSASVTYAKGGSHAPYYRCTATNSQVKVWGHWSYGKKTAAKYAIQACEQATGNACVLSSCRRHVNR